AHRRRSRRFGRSRERPRRRACRALLLPMSELVRAAGGVVVQWRDDGKLEVLLVHRPAYNDWSLPKGKAHEGESDEDCALREVKEETGVRCELGPEVDSTSYVDGKGRPKLVRYWLMWPVAGIAQPYAE